MTKKISKLQYDKLFERKISCVIFDINKLFFDANNKIKQMLNNENIKTRTNKLTFSDVLLYKFKSVFENTNNKRVAGEINFKKNITEKMAHVTNFFRKEQKIPVTFYDNILIEVKNLSKKYSSNSQFIFDTQEQTLPQQEKINNKYKIIAVDGTYTNTNIKNKKTLETSLSMGYFDVINKIPVYLSLKNEEKKNKEIESLINDINQNNFDYTNTILILDRAYFSYSLMHFLDSKNIKFVIRIKNNCVHLEKNKNKNKKRNIKIIKQTPTNIRYINYTADIKDEKKNSKGESIKIIKKVECNIVSNLEIDYTDIDIKNIYNLRWSVEEYFKFVKYNFHFSHLVEHNKKTKECYDKTYIIILIYSLLIDIFESIYKSHYKKHISVKHNINYNKKLMVEGLPNILENIINCNLTEKILYHYYKSFMDVTYSVKNANNPRVSKIPFTRKT